MKTTKHFALMALLVLGTAASAMAGELYPVGDEPNASGEARLTKASGPNMYVAKVSCKGLTPGATYGAVATWHVRLLWNDRGRIVVVYDFWTSAYLGDFVASNNGAGRTAVTLDLTALAEPVRFAVYRSDGTTVLSSSP
jgi:hypothetical protein